MRLGHNLGMIQIGAYQRLRIARRTDFGAYLTDGDSEVLLPRKYVPEGLDVGDSLRVFVATDSEDRPVATTQKPKGVVGEFVVLRAKEVVGIGAFMDWGLDKDLLVPVAEQHRRIAAGERHVVRILLDEESHRVFGSTRLSRYLKGDPAQLRDGQAVSILVADTGPDGARVVIDGIYFGTVFPDEIHERIRTGDERTGYVKRIREDGAIAISLSPMGYQGALDEGPKIMERLRQAGGFLPYGDRSAPEEIRREFGLSKATFKKALGNLYKEGQILIEHHGIRMV